MSTQKPVVFSDSKIKRFEKTVTKHSQERKRELRRVIEGLVDKQINKKFNLFLKDLKIDEALKVHKKTSEALELFEKQKEQKQKELEKSVSDSGKIVADKFSRHAKINDWDSSIYHEDSYDDVLRKLQNVCRDELGKQLGKSTKEGQELESIDNKVSNLILTLSYPNLVARQVDLNKALEDGSSMLSFALNPDTLKQIEGSK
tara:strand:- start:258 stop:863 length:606 start_codon:yes stop_codon:yes gene_type:complete